MGKKTIEERIEIGDESKRLLDSPLFNSIVALILADTMNLLVQTPVNSPQAVALHARLVGMNDFKERLSALSGDATMARDEIKRKR